LECEAERLEEERDRRWARMAGGMMADVRERESDPKRKKVRICMVLDLFSEGGSLNVR
jgi:hypothetical protein